jgi:hypothetical protein
MSLLPQDWVHKVEAGAIARGARIGLAVLAALLLVVAYDLRAYKNFASPEAMDQAQLARNISEGKGYTTLYIRPFSMFLVKRANLDRLASLNPEQRKDLSQVWGPHPDIANAPVYPLVLAGLMKTVPATSDSTKERPFWWSNGGFARYQPDFCIALFNQVLLLAAAFMTFRLARRFFDRPVAWLSAILMFCSELLWRFSVSGLSTMLLLVIFMAVLWLLASVADEAGAAQAAYQTGVPQPSVRRLLLLGIGLGLLLGVGMLTRYVFGFLVIPVFLFVLLSGARGRIPAAIVLVLVFVAVVAPWVARNLAVCGVPFGTAGYALLENSTFFPGDKLQRSLTPGFQNIWLTPLWWKFFTNFRRIITFEIFQFGGSWISAFFLVGLMVPFRSVPIARLRQLVLYSAATLVIAQALGRTAASDDTPEINSENLLVLLLPVVIIYGVACFHTLLDQDHMPPRQSFARLVIIVVFAILVSLPMISVFLPPKPSSIAAPYSPPAIQSVSRWMHPGELIMSDMPWAVAWYGNRQSVLITLDVLEDQSDFYAISDFIKPVKALYLTPVSLDARFLSDWAHGGTERSWGNLILSAYSKGVIPERFPLVKSIRLPEQLFLTDTERWNKN